MNKIKTFITGVFLMITSLSSYAGESAKNSEIALKINRQVIQPVLIAHKICRDDRDCEHQNVAMWSAGTGIEFYIYGISDRKLISEILIVIIQASNQYPSNLQLAVKVFSHTHSERSVWKRPIAQLLIKGEK